MKRESTNESFENFLKQNADNLRMKAPERVWQNLSQKLDKRRRWFGFKYGAFLLLATALGYFVVSNIELKKLPAPTTMQQQQTVTSKAMDKENRSLSTTQSHQSSQPIAIVTKAGKGKVSLQQAPVTNSIINAPNTNSVPDNIEPDGQSELVTQNDFTPTIVDSYDELANHTYKQKPSSTPFFTTHNDAPLSIESVINSYRPKPGKWQTSFYIAPTISYRKLAENKSYSRNILYSNLPSGYSALYYNVNNMVTHKPDLGFELGMSEKYSLSQKLRVLAGLQFNVNRYDIKAFNSPLSLATIALNTRSGARADSVTTITSYSNVNGYKSDWLQNLSFQVSAPVGFELAIRGSDKMQLGIGTSVQPTYVLGDRSYMITTDYKSYTQVPWLLRRWNVNTAFETFVSYQSGKTRWQFGPQVRYQLLSSFISQYPVKENLFDFGVKVGVSVR